MQLNISAYAMYRLNLFQTVFASPVLQLKDGMEINVCA